MHDRLFSINLSGLSVNQDGLLEYIEDRLRHYNLSASLFCFEITETAAVANFRHAFDLIHSLKAMGFRFSLDDFGSGLSSFGYLKNLPVDFLKIDGSFISGIEKNPKDFAMVRAIGQMGHELQLKVVAEYVENMEIYRMLETVGIDYVQGYAIQKPEPLVNMV